MRDRVLCVLLFIFLISIIAVVPAHADLSLSYEFNGTGNWSLDAVGGNSTPVGDLSVVVPTGSTVVRAFLYSSEYSLSGPITAPTVQLGAVTYNPGSFTSLGNYQPEPGPNPNFYLGAYVTDVTAQVATAVGGGSAVAFTFAVNNENPNNGIDGEALVVVYSNPAELQRSIFLFDGYSASAGDSFNVNFASPLDTTITGFEALYSLGIGFGAGGSQYSQVDIDGRHLTTSAGGADDGSLYNGALITLGGIGDNPANPNPAPSQADDELYNLALGNSANAAPFLANGISSFKVDTRNPSLDDNIFFAGLNITANATVSTVPEPATLLLVGLGLVGLAGVRRKMHK